MGGLAGEGDVNIVLRTLQLSRSLASISPSFTPAVQESQMDYSEIIDQAMDRITANLDSVMAAQDLSLIHI
mgnify:CR=1 FL=1